jgi:hypothetical protein
VIVSPTITLYFIFQNHLSIAKTQWSFAMDANKQHDEVSALADDVLLGAKSIAEHITALGFPVDEGDVYYLHRAKKWPFNKYGSFLIASKRLLTRHAEKLLRGTQQDSRERAKPESAS